MTRMRRLIKTLILTLSLPFVFLAAAPAFALDCTANPSTPACQIQGGVSTAGGVDQSAASQSVSNTLTTVINIFSLVVGIIAVFMIIIGGLNYITSGGNDSKTASAKQTILYAVVGLIIVGFAQAIVRLAIHTGNPSSTVPVESGHVSSSSSLNGGGGGNVFQ